MACSCINSVPNLPPPGTETEVQVKVPQELKIAKNKKEKNRERIRAEKFSRTLFGCGFRGNRLTMTVIGGK